MHQIFYYLLVYFSLLLLVLAYFKMKFHKRDLRKTVVISCLKITGFTLMVLWLFYKFVWRLHLPPSNPSVIASFGNGRLGNQMSSFASLYAFSKLYSFKQLATKKQGDMLRFYFGQSIKDDIRIAEVELYDYTIKLFGWRLYRIVWDRPWTALNSIDGNFNYSFISNVQLKTGLAIDGGEFPNEVKSFLQFLPELRLRFVPQERFLRSAHGKLDALRAGRNNQDWLKTQFVGVHIRRGDYGQHLEYLYKINQLESQYFIKAMKFFKNRYDSVIFVVVSDDIPWAKENLGDLPDLDVVFLGNTKVLEKDISNPLKPGEDIGEDLALLISCNHTIMSFGTFGMWGSLLAGGQVVVPSSFLVTKEGREVREAGLIQSGDWHVINV